MKKKSTIFIILLIAFLFFRDNIPYISSSISLTVSIVFFIISYLFFLYTQGPSVFSKYLLIFSVPIADTLFALFSPSSGSFDVSVYTLIQLIIWAFVSDFILKNREEKSLKYLFVIIIFSVIVTSITTYIGCLLMPGASRDMASGLIDDRVQMSLYTSMNIGGFGFAYMLVLLLSGLFYILRFRTLHLKMKVIIIVIILLFAITIYTTEYTTAILFAILSFSIMLLPRRFTFSNVFLIFVAMVPIVVIASSYLPSLLHIFSKSTDSYNISIRMEELGVLTSGGTGYGDAQGRINLWLLSWQNFYTNFLYGSGNNGGGHSYILDTMSRYGVWGLIVVILQFVYLYKLTIKPYLKTNYSTLFIFIYIINLCFCIVNTQCFYVIFLLFIPLFISQFDYHEENSRKTFLLKRHESLHHHNRNIS